jgi:branched-chain amino acid transport system substrate-binding protein
MKRSSFLNNVLGAGTIIAVPNQITQTPAPFTPTLRIAVIAPLSGPLKEYGLQLTDGVQAAVDEQNQTRFQNERAFIFDAYDDQNDPPQALARANFVCGSPDVIATIGHLGAAATLATLNTYSQFVMPLIVPTVTDNRLTNQGYLNVFRLPSSDRDEGQLLGAYAVKTGSKAPHVVHGGDVTGLSLATGFVSRAASLHVAAATTVADFLHSDPAGIARMILAKEPDFVAFAGTVQRLGGIMDALHEAGYTGRFAGTQGFFDQATIAAHSPACEGMIVSTDVPYFPLAPTALPDVQRYEGRRGKMSPVAGFGYSAVQLLADVMRRTSAVTRISMVRGLTNGGSYDTVMGSYTFGVTGDQIDPNVYFYAVRNGKFAYERQAHSSGFMLR